MQLTPSLHRIGNDIIAAYLIVTPAGVTIIDAGLPGHWHDLLAELRSIDRTLRDIKGLILTHGDSDHVGFAERLRRDHGIPVFIHRNDADRAKGGPKPQTPRQSMKLVPSLEFFTYSIRKGGLRPIWLTEVSELNGGEKLDLPGSPEVIDVPGHSPGSIAVYSAEVDALFVGDALTTRHVLTGREGSQAAPFTDDPSQAAASLEKLVSTEARWVLPGHGAPWNEGVKSCVAAASARASASPGHTT